MDVPLAGLASIAFCLAFSAFFSASETALTALSPAKTRRLIDEGGRAQARLRHWLERPAHVLTTILICNNVVNVTASALATKVAETMLAGSEGAFASPVAVAVGVMTLLLLTFGEITPKTLARVHAERFSVVAMSVLVPVGRVLTPANLLFVGLSARLARLGGNSIDNDEPLVEEDDITYLARLGTDEGTIEQEHARMIHGVFALDDTTIAGVMVPRELVVALPLDAPRDEVVSTLIGAGHSRVPVFADDLDDIRGIVHAKDMLRLIDRSPDSSDFSLVDHVRAAMDVRPEAPIDSVLQRMRRLRLHLAIVRETAPDGSKGPVLGVVTMEDILEELIGEIYDEFDATAPVAVLRARVDADAAPDNAADASVASPTTPPGSNKSAAFAS